MNHIKRHWIIYLFAFMVLFFAYLFPNIQVELTGGFAWFLTLVELFIVAIIFYAGIFGGEVSYKSEGLIPMIKRFRKEKVHNKKVWFEWLIGKRK